MAEEQVSSVLQRLQDVRGFAFDLDGTIWEAREAASRRHPHWSRTCTRRGSGSSTRRTIPDMVRGCCGASSASWAWSRARRRSSRPSTWSARRSGDGSTGPDPGDRHRRAGRDPGIPRAHAGGDRGVRTAQAVVVGIDPDFSYNRLRRAAAGRRRGSVPSPST
jgi:hypothetical protein